MIIYNPLDGLALTNSIPSKPRHCFLMTRLGMPIPAEVIQIRESITAICEEYGYTVIDASTEVTGRDYLLKIWKQIAATPLSIGICHADIPVPTQTNIYYEFGVAQALGKETVIIKSTSTNVPSDFVRTEYIEFNDTFKQNFSKYLNHMDSIAEYYEVMADQLEHDPVLAIDYLKRAFLITGNKRLRKKVKQLVNNAGLQNRAKNSVELLAAAF